MRMKGTVITAALLAAFALPAFADDVIKKDDSARVADTSVTSTSVTRENNMTRTVKTKSHGCMKRYNAMM
jgi:hypothetical protein